MSFGGLQGRIADKDELVRPAGSNMTGVQVEDTRICVVMVGLPARGKSLISQKGKRFELSCRLL